MDPATPSTGASGAQPLMVPCVGCGVMLRMPARAAGRTVRCPACKTTFRVPGRADDAEDLISHWIEEDVDGERQRREQELRERARRRRGAAASPDGPGAAPPPSNAGAAPAESPGTRPSAKPAAASGPPPQKPPPPSSTPTAAPAGPSAAASPPPRTPAEPRPAIAARPTASNLARSATEAADHRPATDALGEYPTPIRLEAPAPRLGIVSVSPAEAIIEFESRWLDVSAFRASVPMACAMGGEARGRDLVAKPMAFVDRGTPSPPTVADVEQGRVLPITDEFSPGDAVRRAALIDRLPTPFNRPMYYYVSERLGARSLPCVTRQDETLGTVCRVTMPSLRVALDWVANVNGICGPEYEMFAVDVDRITRGAWQELPARTRERLAGWCDFLPGEQFRCYLNEADFSSHDAGLGGVVITDRRVLFKKHRQHWAVSLERSTTIEVTRQPRFAALTVEDTRGDRHSAGRYHVAGIDHLHDVVADLPHVHVLILESDATGADG